MRKKRHISLKDCYKILQVSQKASYEDVKRSYRKKAFELHPDLNPDKPEASSNFQLLNEAYVKLSHFLKSQESQNLTNEKANDAEPSNEAKQKAKDAYNKEQTRPEKEKQNFQNKEKFKYTKANKDQAKNTQNNKNTTEQEQKKEEQANGFEKQHAAFNEAESNKEDVLKDLLNDPFARRVFQDIYSEINKKSKKNKDFVDVNVEEINAPIKTRKPKKIKFEWGNKKYNFDFTAGVGGMVKTWLRSQIDENLTFKFPLAKLRAGARLRFKISRGLSREMIIVEITLPPEFVIGKPIRLKGLGKRLGSWQGDLYLTLVPITLNQ